MATMQRIRAFVAVNLSVTSVKEIAEAQKALRRHPALASMRVSWVPPANIHQTMKFLGDIDPELVEGVTAAVRKAVAETRPFPVEAAGLGAFPDSKRPRVLWVGLKDPSGDLAALQSRMEQELWEIGFAKEKRAFAPHLTLGRVREGGKDISEAFGELGEVTFGESTIKEVVVYESRLRKQGAEYVVLSRVPLVEVDCPSSEGLETLD